MKSGVLFLFCIPFLHILLFNSGKNHGKETKENKKETIKLLQVIEHDKLYQASC
jgi:hypothetical protein